MDGRYTYLTPILSSPEPPLWRRCLCGITVLWPRPFRKDSLSTSYANLQAESLECKNGATLGMSKPLNHSKDWYGNAQKITADHNIAQNPSRHNTHEMTHNTDVIRGHARLDFSVSLQAHVLITTIAA